MVIEIYVAVDNDITSQFFKKIYKIEMKISEAAAECS